MILVSTCLTGLRLSVQFVMLGGGDIEQLISPSQGAEIFVILEYPRGDQGVPHQVVILGIMEKDPITEMCSNTWNFSHSPASLIPEVWIQRKVDQVVEHVCPHRIREN